MTAERKLTDEQIRAMFAQQYPTDDADLCLPENNNAFRLEALAARARWAAFLRGARGHRDARHAAAELVCAALAQRVAPISDERIAEIAREVFCKGLEDKEGAWGPNTLNQQWLKEIAIPFARALLAEAVHPSPAPQAAPKCRPCNGTGLNLDRLGKECQGCAGTGLDTPSPTAPQEPREQ